MSSKLQFKPSLTVLCKMTSDSSVINHFQFWEIFKKMKGEDSGTESDQMEKKVSVKEDENDVVLHHYDESLDESILAGHPAH